MLNDKNTVVELARLMDMSGPSMLRQLEIVLAGAGQQAALSHIYGEVGIPNGDVDAMRCVDPYHAAALRGDAGMIRWLHAQGAVPSLAQIKSVPLRGDLPNFCESLFLILATMRDDDCTKAMLECGFVHPKWPVFPEAMVYPNTGSEGPAYLLADSRHPKVDHKGWVKTVQEPRPLDFAICNDLPKTTEYLLGLGLEPTSRTFTVLLAANARDRAVAFLEGHPGYADSLLIAAINVKDTEALQQALRRGGNPSVTVRTSRPGDRPFRHPALMACTEIEQIRLLVAAGADPDAKDEHGMSMLVKMVKTPETFGEQHVRELVELGADPAQGYCGKSLLQLAARRTESFKRTLRSLKAGKQIAGAFSADKGSDEAPAAKTSSLPGPL